VIVVGGCASDLETTKIRRMRFEPARSQAAALASDWPSEEQAP